MNTYNINDEEFVNSSIYQNFLKKNSGKGMLNIRAYAASGAIPISNLKVIVSSMINNSKVIFYEGLTNNSGIIENITLPAPPTNSNDLDTPLSTQYEISATYEPDKINKIYNINIFDKIMSIQNINIVPDTVIKAGGFYGR